TERTPSFPFPRDVVTKDLFKFLSVDDLLSFAQVNPTAYTQVRIALLDRAKQFEYQGDNPKEGIEYIRNLFESIQRLFEARLLPQEYCSFEENGLLNKEKTLNKLTDISKKDLLEIIDNIIDKQITNTTKNLFSSNIFKKISGKIDKSDLKFA